MALTLWFSFSMKALGFRSSAILIILLPKLLIRFVICLALSVLRIFNTTWYSICACVCEFLFWLVTEKTREKKVRNYRFLNILSNAGFDFREICIFFNFFFFFFKTVSWQPNFGILRFLAFGYITCWFYCRVILGIRTWRSSFIKHSMFNFNYISSAMIFHCFHSILLLTIFCGNKQNYGFFQNWLNFVPLALFGTNLML